MARGIVMPKMLPITSDSINTNKNEIQFIEIECLAFATKHLNFERRLPRVLYPKRVSVSRSKSSPYEYGI